MDDVMKLQVGSSFPPAQMRYLVVGTMRWIASVLLLLALVLHVGRPDIPSALLGGPFGSARAATLALYAISTVLACLAWLLTAPQRRTRRRMVMATLGAVALVLAGVQMLQRPAYHTSTVHYRSADGTPIEATLYLPRTSGPHPAVVFVGGSAPIRRGAYDVWTSRIASAGTAVLLADKRGVGGTGGTFDRMDNTGAENIARLSADVVAGVDYLHARPDIQRDGIGVVGISQAGWVAPAAAGQDARIRFLALITAPVVSTWEEGVWSRLRGDDHADPTAAMREAESVIDTVGSRGVDARPLLSSLRIPGLWLFGSDDNSVPTRKSARVLDSLVAAGHPFQWKTYRGYGHALIGRGGGEMIPTIAPASWDDLLTFLASSVSPARAGQSP